jgi:pyruvate kinase
VQRDEARKERSVEIDSSFARHDPLAPEVLDRLGLELQELREQLIAGETELADVLASVHPDNLRSARNLVHYLVLRRYDLRPLQLRLARAGLSSLGRCEAHVLATINRVIALLALARGTSPRDGPVPPVEFSQGERILNANAQRLLGRRPSHRRVRIMVTLPAEAAENPVFVHDLVAAGMDCARINCGRDDAAAWEAMAAHVREAAHAQHRECRILADLNGPKPRTGVIGNGAKRLVLTPGDRFELVRNGSHESGVPARPSIGCDTNAVFEAVKKGDPIWFDDGMIGGVVEACAPDRITIRVTAGSADGSKLHPERGINLPETTYAASALTAKDRQDLGEVVRWADAVELSFVQRADDVLALHDALNDYGATELGVVLKIETRRGFADLPQLLLAAMRRRKYGVMIARGDLAVEVGFERMAEIQEEVLWIAEAAHSPTIWATKVLETLAREGGRSRAEMTDAAMSARAEAVMLGKGPHVLETIATLDDILNRMKDHQDKKRTLLRALHVSHSLWP